MIKFLTFYDNHMNNFLSRTAVAPHSDRFTN